jgi:hypothetical protein
MDSHDVETYCERGVWKNRRGDSDLPFSSGGPKLRQVAIGAEVARWNQGRHIIRDNHGVVAEINIYGSGPYPPRSPVTTIRHSIPGIDDWSDPDSDCAPSSERESRDGPPAMPSTDPPGGPSIPAGDSGH